MYTDQVVDGQQLHAVVCQDWELRRAGEWGVHPDGVSLHHSRHDCLSFISEYRQGLPNTVPGEFSRPSGDPYTVFVDKEMLDSIIGFGIRVYGHTTLERIAGDR